MKLNHIQLDKINSTQEHLKSLEFIPEEHVLVSTRIQTKGYGRKGRDWTQFSQTLCFSFTLPKRENITISSAEISCYTLQFLKEKFNFQGGCLKWPNDILNQQIQKVAGILIDVAKDRILVGVGINIAGKTDSSEFDASSILKNKELSESEFHSIPREIFDFILKKYPKTTNDVIEIWNDLCAHKSQKVVIIDDQKKISGVFKGIGGFGEALIFTEEGKLESVFSGTLRLDQGS